MKPDQFFIIDLHNAMWRAFHAKMADLSFHGEPTKVPFLVTRGLRRLVLNHKPAYLCFADDCEKSVLVRRQLSSAYKADRPKPPPEFTMQAHRTRYLLHKLGVPVVRSPGWEADDVCATLARGCVSDEVHIVIVSNDRDFHALLDDARISILDPADDEFVTKATLKSRFGYTAKEYAKAKVLCGDRGDNVKPVREGIGLTTALKFVRGIKSETFPEERLLINRRLVTMRTDCELEVTSHVSHAFRALEMEELAFNGLNHAEAYPVYRELGFGRWADEANASMRQPARDARGRDRTPGTSQDPKTRGQRVKTHGRSRK